MKSGPPQEELYFHVGERFGVRLLSEVSFFLGLVLSWEEAVGLIAKDDLGWAPSVERVRSGAVLQEGSGEPFGVEGALWSQVVCDESFGGLDC